MKQSYHLWRIMSIFATHVRQMSNRTADSNTQRQKSNKSVSTRRMGFAYIHVHSRDSWAKHAWAAHQREIGQSNPTDSVSELVVEGIAGGVLFEDFQVDEFQRRNVRGT